MLFHTGNLAPLKSAQNYQKHRFSHIFPHSRVTTSPWFIRKRHNNKSHFSPCPCPLLTLINNPISDSNSRCCCGTPRTVPSKALPMGQAAPWQISQSRGTTSSLSSVFGWAILHLVRKKTLGFSHLILWDFLGILWAVNTLTSHCIMD